LVLPLLLLLLLLGRPCSTVYFQSLKLHRRFLRNRSSSSTNEVCIMMPFDRPPVRPTTFFTPQRPGVIQQKKEKK